MRILLTLDKNDYSPEMPVRIRYAARAMIVHKGRIATQHGAAGDYKLLGGGLEPGEDYRQGLCREVQEESGLIVIPESIRELGEMIERRRDIFEPGEIFERHSFFYLCEVENRMTEPHMTQSEITKGYRLTWATPEEIVRGNAAFCDSQPWICRDTEFVKWYCRAKDGEGIHTDTKRGLT